MRLLRRLLKNRIWGQEVLIQDFFNPLFAGIGAESIIFPSSARRKGEKVVGRKTTPCKKKFSHRIFFKLTRRQFTNQELNWMLTRIIGYNITCSVHYSSHQSCLSIYVPHMTIEVAFPCEEGTRENLLSKFVIDNFNWPIVIVLHLLKSVATVCISEEHSRWSPHYQIYY